MPKIKYVEDSGVVHEVDVPEGWSVMEGAVKHAVPGIDADCGGNCACGTCHVYVDPAWQDRIPGRHENEWAILEFADALKENSRLSCQIKVTSGLDGLIVRLPTILRSTFPPADRES
jgi:ferredoxin, 2Fe-2S